MTDQEKVYQAIQQWRDSEETQKAMHEKPASYDACIAMQAAAISRATAEDWKTWARTAKKEGARTVAMEITMVGRNIQRAQTR